MLRRANSANGVRPERGRLQRPAHRLAHLALVALQRFQAGLQILRDEGLNGVAVKTDQLAQEVDRQHVGAARFLIHDDLGEDIVRDVLARLGVHDLEVAFLPDHFASRSSVM
jgi:hypothetical protein